MDLNSLAQFLLEGAVSKKYGPDFRTKQAAGQQALQQGSLNMDKTRSEIAGQDVQNQEGQARIPLIQAQAKGAGLENQQREDSLEQVRRDTAELAALAKQPGSGIDSASFAVQKALLESRAAKLLQNTNEANVAHLNAATANEKGKFAHENSLEQMRLSGAKPAAFWDPKQNKAVLAPPAYAMAMGLEPMNNKPTLAEGQANRQSQSVLDTIGKMHELAKAPLTTGFFAGNASKAYKAIKGPEGLPGEDKEYDFDQLGRQAVDLVYIKSGKQINSQEMQLLKQMIPSRSRDNLPAQVKVFEDYANQLLKPYGGAGEQPGVPTAPSGTRVTGSPIKILKIEKIQ